MKRTLLSFILSCTFIGINAQTILGLSVSPTNPTTDDFIYLYADLSFPSGTCDTKTVTQSQSGNTIYGYGLHCIGPLTYICNSTDTIIAGVLPAGNYAFVFSVDAGFGFPTCTPGIVAGPMDTLLFTVSSVTDIKETSADQPDVYMESNSMLHISFSSKKTEATVNIYNISGEIVYSGIVNDNPVDLSGKEAGIYIVSISSAQGIWNKKISKLSR